jgi:hypothetical protein
VQKDPETTGNPDGITPDPKPTVEALPPPESKTEQSHDKAEQREEIMQQDQDTVKDQPPPNPGDADAEVDARTRANRQNSLKSTGAKTPEGREASSRNAVKHGLFAADITKYFRTEEESERYQRFIDGIVKDIAPVGDLESILARRAADIQFRLEALRTAEFKVYAGGALLNDTMEELLERSKNVIGLASLYDSRFQRAFSKTMEDLSRAQKSRRDKELHALEQLKGIALAHIKENATFDPAKFGFVISRDFVFNQAHLANAKKLATFCTGHDMMEKKVVDYVAKVPPKAA